MKALITSVAIALTLAPSVGIAGPKGCPPGLAKKNNGCMPPGLAKKKVQQDHAERYTTRGDWDGDERVGDGWRRVDPAEYGLPPAPAGEDYYTDGDRIVSVMRDTLEIVAFVALVAAVSRWAKAQQDAAEAGR